MKDVSLPQPDASRISAEAQGSAHSLGTLETPALILDRSRLRQNVARMAVHLATSNVALRPHMKTAKSIPVAYEVLGASGGPITVSTLREVDAFIEAGFRDILYAVGIAPSKLDHVGAAIGRGVRMSIILDSPEMARTVDEKGRALGICFEVLIEIDSDQHRSGVPAESPLLIEIGQILAGAQGASLRGVMTHAGGSYNCRGDDEIRAHASKERAAILTAAERLRAVGLACPVVSMGSTPTALFCDDFQGVTEVRAGVYMFQDLVMMGLGVCEAQDIAISVLCTVIGHQENGDWVTVDAGWMAMSRDRGTANQEIDQGYGLVCDVDGHVIGELVMFNANQEHGLLRHRSQDRLDLTRYPIGTLLRILPNHACATSAQHGGYHVTDGQRTIIDHWSRFGGW